MYISVFLEVSYIGTVDVYKRTWDCHISFLQHRNNADTIFYISTTLIAVHNANL